MRRQLDPASSDKAVKRFDISTIGFEAGDRSTKIALESAFCGCLLLFTGDHVIELPKVVGDCVVGCNFRSKSVITQLISAHKFLVQRATESC